ncbi:hypothetical protein [Streptomyces sp. NPDC048637]|uniref:hypothetical protein n=1 Tax=Streptomyces sp. NPDC048637 TaxID=3155636 RepID=UPI00342A16D7
MAGAGGAERMHLSIAAELLYVHRHATSRLRHHLTNGPLGEELAERLHSARRIDYVRLRHWRRPCPLERPPPVPPLARTT